MHITFNVGPNLAKEFDKHSKRFLNHTKGSFINSMFLNEITVDEVQKEIAKLNPMKSCGVDGINPKVIRQTGNHISQPLCHIFNLMFIALALFPKN